MVIKDLKEDKKVGTSKRKKKSELEEEGKAVQKQEECLE